MELDNWSGLGVTGQPEFFKQAIASEELKRSCVYFLIHNSPDDEIPTIYVGESDDFTKRYASGNFPIDFDTFLIFTSKDDNLTRAHVKWVELEIWQKLTANPGKVSVANANRPTGSNLPRADIAMMSTYLTNLVFVLEALGFDIFSNKQRVYVPVAPFEPDRASSGTGLFETTTLPRRDDALRSSRQPMLATGLGLDRRSIHSLQTACRRT